MRALWHRHRKPQVVPSTVQLPSAEDSHPQFHEGIGGHLQKDAHSQFPQEARAPVQAEPAATGGELLILIGLRVGFSDFHALTRLWPR
jgi:hypothetical protein